MDIPFRFVNDLDDRLPPVNAQSGFRIYKVVKLLLLLSLVYSISGLWLGENGSSLHWFIIVKTGCSFLIWSFMKYYIYEYISSRRSKRIQIWLYCIIPWSFISRCWGWIAAINLPLVPRVCIYMLYCIIFGVNRHEVEYSLSSYTSISSFFTRRLMKNVRIVASKGCLVAPCDGTVVHCGVLSKNQIQVKGIDYYVNQFLGFTPVGINTKSETPTKLFHCVLYLAPGDYHRFHSPCDWMVFKRCYFPGQTLSVSPKLVRWFPNLLSINERAIYRGIWQHGIFIYSVVGATNVGSILVDKDDTLKTNCRKNRKDIRHFTSFSLKRGEEVGMFNMGSTIVLIFEAPQDFEFNINVNDKVKVGSQLNILKKLSAETEEYETYECGDCNMETDCQDLDIYSVL